MPNFHVTWEIDLEADSHEDAAKIARSIQLDPDSVLEYDVEQVFESSPNRPRRIRLLPNR